MLTLFPGWTIARAIPLDMIVGLFTGQYTLHGGTIRWAAGTEGAGRIVRHLLPVSNGTVTDIVNVFGPSSTTQNVLQMATATMATSGLNLVVSSVGFAVLYGKLNQLDARLDAIQKDVHAIRELLERKERAELRAAMDSLQQIERIEHPATRLHILAYARQKLAELVQQYADVLHHAEDIETALAAEEYFCLVALALVRCYIEMDEVRMAQHQLQHTQQVWRTHTRRIAKTQLLGEHPERLLFSDFVADAPMNAVVEWLDFAHNEQRGAAWVDHLRASTNPWYREQGFHFGIGLPYSQHDDHRQDIEVVIPALQKYVARQKVWESYIDQLQAFESYNVSPRSFQHALTQVDSSLIVEGYIILEPEQLAEPIKRRWFHT